MGFCIYNILSELLENLNIKSINFQQRSFYLYVKEKQNTCRMITVPKQHSYLQMQMKEEDNMNFWFQ